ncbi:MAG: hypothetical protein OD918_11495 [Gammaproteobacteria bacterium]
MPTNQTNSAGKLLDFRTAYFALVGVISLLVLGFSLVGFLHDAILFIFPALVEADVAKDMAQFARSGADSDAQQTWGYTGPRFGEMVENGLTVLVMGAIFWVHGLRFFREARA